MYYSVTFHKYKELLVKFSNILAILHWWPIHIQNANSFSHRKTLWRCFTFTLPLYILQETDLSQNVLSLSPPWSTNCTQDVYVYMPMILSNSVIKSNPYLFKNTCNNSDYIVLLDLHHSNPFSRCRQTHGTATYCSMYNRCYATTIR